MDSCKVCRILGIYSQLIDGRVINKSEQAVKYGVNERTIQRDIDDIRKFFDNNINEGGIVNSVIYDRYTRGYKLNQMYQMKLTNREILAICKILLDSRALPKDSMVGMLDKLVSSCVPENDCKVVKELIANESFHYIEPRHKSNFLDILWTIGQAIYTSSYITIKYERTKDKNIVTRKLKPVAIMFSEYYFYLTAFIDDEEVKKNFDIINDSFPTIYRIDRIIGIETGEEHFHIPYVSRFEEGEFKKRIQFMIGGKLEKIKFRYYGNDIDAILDRLPTAKILEFDEKGYLVAAEVFGKGINMWIRSQGNLVEVVDN